jgi:hypothetical protein
VEKGGEGWRREEKGRVHRVGAWANSQTVDSLHFIRVRLLHLLFTSPLSSNLLLFSLSSSTFTAVLFLSSSPYPLFVFLSPSSSFSTPFSPISGMCKDLQALDTLLVDGTVLMNSGVAKTVVAISTNTQLADITDPDPGE